MLIGQITARAAGIAWYASAIIGLHGETHRLNEDSEVPRENQEDERVRGENCDGILGFDTEIDECIGEVLNTLSPGSLWVSVEDKKEKRREPTIQNRCSMSGALHLGG